MSAPETGKVSLHPHDLKKETRLGYRCDGCGRSDNRRYRCSTGCDWDLCGNCWDKHRIVEQPAAASAQTPAAGGASPTIAVHPSHPHKLELFARSGYSCDVCRRSDDRRYRCKNGCDYDLCGACWDKGPLTVEAEPAPVAAVSAPTSAGAAPATSNREEEEKKAENNMHPLHPHEMKRTDGGSYGCDGCRRNGSSFRYRCAKGCDFDLCDNCWNKKSESGASSSASSASSSSSQARQLDLDTLVMYAYTMTDVGEEGRKVLAQLPPGYRHHQHPLVEKLDSTSAWGCDKCGAEGIDLVKRFRCSKRCDFDLCQKCYTGEENQVRGQDYTFIRAGPPEITGLPLRSEFDETQTNFWDSLRAPYAGKIMFSDEPIDRFLQGVALKDEFGPGSPIHGRAVWPHAFRNYPIAHKKDDPSQPIYGPKFILADGYGHRHLHALQVFLFVTIDGKPVTRDIKYGNEKIDCAALAVSTEVGPRPPGASPGYHHAGTYLEYGAKGFKPETTDFYAMNQSMVFRLVKEEFNLQDSWEQGIPTMLKHLAQLPAGRHEVEVDIRFRITPDTDSCKRYRGSYPDEELFPSREATPISHPMAVGRFTYVVPEGASITVADPFPKRKTSLPDEEAERLEGIILQVMKESPEWGSRRAKTERILKVVITGDTWSQLRKQHECTRNCHEPCHKYDSEAWRYSIDFAAVCYRSPVDGWDEEKPCAVFNLGAMAFSKEPQSKGDIIGIGVGGHYEIDVDLVSDGAFEAAGVRRCPEALRRGFTSK